MADVKYITVSLTSVIYNILPASPIFFFQKKLHPFGIVLLIPPCINQKVTVAHFLCSQISVLALLIEKETVKLALDQQKAAASYDLY